VSEKPLHVRVEVGRLPPKVLEGEGQTPLVAVCNLILALANAGKLEAVRD